MSDFTMVDPRGWEYDLHSVYSAYIGFFQLHNIPWWDRSWGHLFSSFEEFLAFSWPVITVTDTWTGRAHIVTRLNSIGAFLRMIKTRFGETLIQAPNILQVTPFETANRHLRHISDYASYKKIHSTLPATVLTAFKTRIRAGEPKAVKELWQKKDKTYLAVDFEWSGRNEKSVLEWGYAAMRCGHLQALGQWPPIPDANYRRGHFIVGEYVDKVVNKHFTTFPWHYAFGESQVISKTKLPEIIQAVISSLASPESETTANSLVLVAHGASGDLSRLEEMKIKIPHNMLILDTATYERALYSAGHRGIMLDPNTNKARTHGSTLSLDNMLRSFTTTPLAPPAPSTPTTPDNPSSSTPLPASTPPAPNILPNVTMHNSGNDAFMCLFALQMLLDPTHTQMPTVKKGRIGRSGLMKAPVQMMGPSPMSMNGNMSMGSPAFSGYVPIPVVASYGLQVPSSSYDLANEFGQMRIERSQSKSPKSPVNAQGTAGAGGSLAGKQGSNSWKMVNGSGSGRRH